MARCTAATESPLVWKPYSTKIGDEEAPRTGAATGCRGRHTVEHVAGVDATPVMAGSSAVQSCAAGAASTQTMSRVTACTAGAVVGAGEGLGSVVWPLESGDSA